MEGTNTAVGALAAFFAYVALHSAWTRHRRATTLRRAAAALTDAVVDAEQGTVTGYVAGRAARCELALRGSGRSSVAWMEVTITLGGPTIDLQLRPQTLGEEIDLKRGMSIDVTTGDPAFDRKFIVEGAPTSAVREVLADEPLRLALAGLGAVEATQSDGALMLAKKGWLWGHDLATMATTAGTLAARLCEVASKLPRAERDAYRGERPVAGGAEADRDRSALATARATRARKPTAVSVFIGVGVALFVLVWLAAVFAPR